MNLSIKLDLLKLAGAFVTNLKGKTVTKRCLIIPIDDAQLFLGEKGTYLNLMAWEMQNSQYGDSHFIKQSISKEYLETLTEDERRNLPILGSIKPYAQQQAQVHTQTNGQTALENPDDLPF